MPKDMFLKRCPICGGVVSIGVCDDEGNYHGECGCEYEQDHYSGLSYSLRHQDDISCALRGCETIGHMLYDTADEAAAAWNGTLRRFFTPRRKAVLSKRTYSVLTELEREALNFRNAARERKEEK